MIGMVFVLCFVMAGIFTQCKKSADEAVTAPSPGPAAAAAPAPDRSGPGGGPGGPAAPSRAVVINGQRLSDETIATLERAFRVRIMDGQFWYDKMNGSWGIQGGPTAGFIMAGLDLGGPLRADASNGTTGVFINGRQLHQIDVARLSRLGPVYQGRYWMDAWGNMGIEGMPALLNIWAVIQSLGGGGGQREGILSTYDKTGIAVIGN
jgi:hypothetical protein